MKSLQLKVTFVNGKTLTGDVIRLDEALIKARANPPTVRGRSIHITEQDIEAEIEKMIQLVEQCGKMEYFSFTVNGNVVGINPKNVLYIEMIKD